MRKLANGVVESICKYCEDTEVPAIFSVWIGIATVSATLGRDCFIDQGYFTIYPNLYIILVAGSARCRKSTAIRIAKNFMDKVEPSINIVSQKVTPEGLIGALSGMIGEEGATRVVPSAVGISIVSELSTLIDRNAFKSGLIALLTDLYDSEDFEYLTRARGKELVKNPCLSILGGSTTQWIKEAIPEIAIGGGFTSRILFIYKDKREKLVPWPFITEDNKKMADDIVHDLNQIAKLRGQFALDAEALDMFKSEYVSFYHGKLMDDEQLSGYANRRHSILLKIAIVVSASKSDSKLITADDMRVAMSLMRKAEDSMPIVFRAILSNQTGDIFDQIVRFMMSNRIVMRSELISQFRHKMTSQELDIMIRTLEEEGVIKTEVDGRSVRYIFLFNK